MINNEFDESKHPRDEKGQFTKKEKTTDDKTKKQLNYQGAEVNIIYDGKYADVKIQLPKGHKFNNGDEWYRTQTTRDNAETLAKKIIDEQFKKVENSYISQKLRLELGKNY
jgi:hypothetical protein